MPAGIVAAHALGMGRIAHVYHYQSCFSIRHVGVVSPHRYARGPPAGLAAAHALGMGRIAHVDHLQPGFARRHVGVVPAHRHAFGTAVGLAAAHPLGVGGITHVNHLQAHFVRRYIGVMPAHRHAIGRPASPSRPLAHQNWIRSLHRAGQHQRQHYQSPARMDDFDSPLVGFGILHRDGHVDQD
ncbi:MAG: hypothetical protein BWX84_03040 [Verrucomicrobia bacterium ADurb.Bin118]|nr:MAG: hypothetical protein BWX84_03040 [Verrucomicrobia bacterium ADurb.Bin118]